MTSYNSQPSRAGCQYSDPVDLIWIAAAEQLGMQVERSPDVYASWDGINRLRIANQEDFDPDDCMAQMIFHELCHALVAGKEGMTKEDWGLDNTSARDLLQEHATHRVQAALSAPWGLRRFLAATTQWRPHYDGLPHDPMIDDGDPSIPVAQAALRRAQEQPWSSVLTRALESTAQVAKITRPFAPSDSLWERTDNA